VTNGTIRQPIAIAWKSGFMDSSTHKDDPRTFFATPVHGGMPISESAISRWDDNVRFAIPEVLYRIQVHAVSARRMSAILLRIFRIWPSCRNQLPVR
jgi:hypothetical protein